VASALATSRSPWPCSSVLREYASAVSMMVTPASSEAWMVVMACVLSGLPSMERGISPKPMALTVRLPICRVCMEVNLHNRSGRPAAQMYIPPFTPST
jgi:hypothetical protein